MSNPLVPALRPIYAIVQFFRDHRRLRNVRRQIRPSRKGGFNRGGAGISSCVEKHVACVRCITNLKESCNNDD